MKFWLALSLLVTMPCASWAQDVPSGGDYIVRLGTNSTTLVERMRVTQAGLVGIGTSSPNMKLNVSGTDVLLNDYTSATSNTSLHLRTDGVTSFINNMNNFVSNGSNGNGVLLITGQGGVSLYYGSTGCCGTPGLILSSAGLVGIGGNTPAYQLDVSGTMSSVASLTNSTGRYGALAQNNTTTTANGTYANTGLYAAVTANIASGITNSGNIIGANIGSFNQAAGNISSLYGINLSFGGNTGTGTITNAYGMVLTSYQNSGTTTNAYGLFIQDMKATNGYGIYQTGADDNNYFAGDIGIGVTNPTTALDVSGTILSRPFNAGAATSLDWSQSNMQYTTANCGAFTFTNMQDGGNYTLAVKGTTSGTCSFSHTGLTFHLPTDHGATTASKHTLYSFVRMGADVYVAWAKGL